MGDMQRHLLEMIAGKSKEGLGYPEIREAILSDGLMLAASASYCEQCGKCCSKNCGNISFDEGKSYCNLQGREHKTYPDGKIISRYGKDTDSKLNPDFFAKPLVCHTYGPHVAFIPALDKGVLEKDPDFSLCKGAEVMATDFKRLKI